MGKHRFNLSDFKVKPQSIVDLDDFDPAWTNGIKDKEEAKEALQEDVDELSKAQEILWASGQKGVLIIFQALDAAGKDSTIKHVMSGVNPQGCSVNGFKAPSDEEKQHHFLWRPNRFLPAKGQIAIFNRSYYEEVLVVRVHPNFLKGQLLPQDFDANNIEKLWNRRYDDINQWEDSLNRQGITIIKFFLNVSKEEQKLRFLDRLDKPEKNFKFSAADLQERAFWNDYRYAYEHMLSATSTGVAPWYVIPADKKWFTRAVVADIITQRIEEMDLKIPKLSQTQIDELAKSKALLLAE
jgi:PPK2 family polyphosphate:nucleotide phosphotransferase